MPSVSKMARDTTESRSFFSVSMFHKTISNRSDSTYQTVCQRCPLQDSMEALGWAHFPLKHFWNIGYQAHSIIKIFIKLPPRLNLALMSFCNALHYLAQDSTKALEFKLLLSGCDCDIAGFYYVGHYRHSDDVHFWEEEHQYGLISIDFDPVNQSRKSFEVNTRAAHIWNMGRAELINRFQACDVPLLLTELDWIRSFSAYLATYFDDTVTQFLRFITACGGTFNGTLVCMTTTKTFDSVGRIAQACCPHAARPSRNPGCVS